jgi:hypothetical protein
VCLISPTSVASYAAILADLGADVIQVEPPTGNSARCIGPFYQDEVHPERSLFWWAIPPISAASRSISLLQTGERSSNAWCNRRIFH